MIRGAISLVIVGAIMLAGLAVVKGPDFLTRLLPDRVAAALQAKAASTRVVKGTGEEASDYLDDRADGLMATGPIAAMAGNRPVFIADVVSGYSTRVADDIPAEITMIRPISGCRLTPPLDGTTVGHVSAAASGLTLPFLTYDDEDLAAAVQGLVDAYRETGSVDVPVPPALAYQAYDVAVTETRAPVYLVLETTMRNVIWNLHLAPGARIERVILLGGSHAGVANLDPVVPVEVLPGLPMADCGIEPAYAPNPGAEVVTTAKTGTGSAKQAATAKLATMQDSANAYNTWFRDSFGVHADDTRAGFDAGTISVVGPQPGDAEPKAAYAPIQASRIRMTQDSYFEIAGQVAPGEDFAGRVKAIATSFAFGDLKTLSQGAAF